jgi:UDP-3-O-[3-hydroxymyristoyl] glucosamine N-acyltransferase
MDKTRKLIIVGDSVFAEVAYEYFTHDSEYEVVAFSVEEKYLKRETLFDLAIVPFEKLPEIYPPAQHSVYAAVVFVHADLRARLYHRAVEIGYAAASYVSSQASMSPTAKVGEHCFVCEATVVQQYAEVCDNVVLWSGNLIGQHATVRKNCFILPNTVVYNRAEIGENIVVGANVTVCEGVRVPDDSIIEIAAVITNGSKQI